MSTKKGKNETRWSLSTHPSLRIPFVYHVGQGLIVSPLQSPHKLFLIQLEAGLVVLIYQCTGSDANEILQQKLKLRGEGVGGEGGKKRQWVFERAS